MKQIVDDPEDDAMRGALPIEKFMFAVFVIALAISEGYIVWQFATRDARIEAERAAVSVGAARWDAGEKGEPIFAWRTCTAPMGVMK